MATYKPKKKIDNNGTLEEVKIPIESVDGLLETVDKKANKSDINALLAKTEEKFNSLVTANNKGKTISYGDKLYIVDVQTPSPSPPQVGDTLTALYFDTTKEVDLSVFPGFSLISGCFANEPDKERAIFVAINGKLYFPNSDGLIRSVYDSNGWLIPRVILLQSITITSINQNYKHLWEDFVSITSFDGLEVKEIASPDNFVSQYKDVEDKEKPILTNQFDSAYNTTSATNFSPNVTINHSKGRLSATELRENGVSLADKYALKDEVGGAGLEDVGSIDFCPNELATDIRCYDSGIYWEEPATGFFDKGGKQLNIGAKTFHRVPIISGDGIAFEQNEEQGQVKISTDLPTEEVEAIDLPTVRAKLKPASEVGGGSNAPIPIFLQGVLNGESSETGPSIRDLLGGSECYAIGVLVFESESGEGAVCGSDGDSHWLDIVDDTYQVTIAPNWFMLDTVATRMATYSTDIYPWKGTTIRGYINILGPAIQ